MTSDPTYTAFRGQQRVLTASLPDLLTHLKSEETPTDILVFDDQTGRQTDFDLSGTLEDVLMRHDPAPKPGPGRPKLGVTPREITLLPRHWEWLDRQRGGASATLRRLIDEARKADPEGEARAQAQAATDRFLNVVAGDLPGYEEATRALYAGDRAAFTARMADWPGDIREHALFLGAAAFAESALPKH